MRALRMACLFLAAGLLCCHSARGDDRHNGIELRKAERIVLLGGTLIEREQTFGDWETQLTVAAAGQNITVRNLGWSGDTVWGESRGLFEPHLGYQRLVEHVQAADPTLVIIAYGNNEAFAGESRLDEFITQYAKLLDDLKADGRGFVLVSPLLMEAASLPRDPDVAPDDAAAYNHHADLYADAIAALAGKKGHGFIDLRPPQRAYVSAGGSPLTFNGLHLTDAGYRQTARWFVSRFLPSVRVDEYDDDAPAAAELQAAVVAKNELFFYRWRPQNFTYLFGFRKHEQGQNAVEVPQFDPLIEAAEHRIAKLAQKAVSTGANEGNEGS